MANWIKFDMYIFGNWLSGFEMERETEEPRFDLLW